MSTATTIQAASVRELRGTFADLVCADPDLIRAEFDAIIDASWGSEAPPRQPDQPHASDQPAPDQPSQQPEVGSTGGKSKPDQPCAIGWTRQRSPPVKPAAK